METRTSKNHILSAAIVKQNLLLLDFKKRIDELKTTIAFEASEIPSQSEKTNAGHAEMLSVLEKEYQFAQDEMVILQQLKKQSAEFTSIKPGAVVVTDKRNFLVGVSTEEFEAEGKPYFGLSTAAPIYSVMSGKKTGDSFAFGLQNYTILDVY